jgi:hypothetical protein
LALLLFRGLSWLLFRSPVLSISVLVTAHYIDVFLSTVFFAATDIRLSDEL